MELVFDQYNIKIYSSLVFLVSDGNGNKVESAVTFSIKNHFVSEIFAN